MRLALLKIFTLLSFGIMAHPGIGIVEDSKGNVFYTDLTHVWKIDNEGNKSIAVRNVHTHELRIDSDDNLFGSDVTYSGEVTDKWYTRIWKLSADGKLSDYIPKTEGFLRDYSFLVDGRGNSYFTQGSPANKVMKKDSKGDISVHVKRPFEDIRWMVCKEDGSLYIIDFLKLIKIEPNGVPSVVVENLKETKVSHNWVQDRHNAMGIWFDDNQNIYVAIYGGRMIKKVSPEGEESVVLETEFDWSPTGGLFSRDGSMWVLEYSLMNKARVRRIDSDGQIQIWE